MENKFVEFIENNKKVIISSVAVGVVLVLGFGWYSYNQQQAEQQAEQQAKIVQLEKDSKSDKEQVDKLFESFDASSD
ncbi:putative uroporphyrinogen III C-methyltransferase [Streptococcus pneumoniae]|nr:putative uroporphyrinogen III C-methyltransferase [Streptococcus pneumoniae]